MAAAVRQRAVPYFLEDMIMYGEGLSVSERTVTPAEEGRSPSELRLSSNILLLGVSRGHKRVPFHKLADLTLESGDVLVVLEGDVAMGETTAEETDGASD